MSMDLADWGETVAIEPEPTVEEIEAATEETRTVAHDILDEVKECRSQQDRILVDLTNLQGEGQENSRRYQELLTELKNLREENRSLSQELKALLAEEPGFLPPSIPSTSPPETPIPAPASPEKSGPGEPPKKKRHQVL
jgi:hypothetical protein